MNMYCTQMEPLQKRHKNREKLNVDLRLGIDDSLFDKIGMKNPFREDHFSEILIIFF